MTSKAICFAPPSFHISQFPHILISTNIPLYNIWCLSSYLSVLIILQNKKIHEDPMQCRVLFFLVDLGESGELFCDWLFTSVHLLSTNVHICHLNVNARWQHWYRETTELAINFKTDIVIVETKWIRSGQIISRSRTLIITIFKSHICLGHYTGCLFRHLSQHW